jgi:molecular chaperone GrpE
MEEIIESVPEENDAQSEAVENHLAALTGDLQRIQAEYSNYRKRVDRDRVLKDELAIGSVLAALVPILDDVDRAQDHGELQGGFKAIADKLTKVTTTFGLQKYGEAGDLFNPQVHEALLHSTSAEVTESTATAILQPGYKYGNHILRPAQVAVTDPE